MPNALEAATPSSDRPGLVYSVVVPNMIPERSLDPMCGSYPWEPQPPPGPPDDAKSEGPLATNIKQVMSLSC